MVKTKKKAAKGHTRSLLILFVIVAVLGVIIVWGAYQNLPESVQPPTAEEYFDIIEPTIDDGELVRNQTSGEILAVKIYAISYKVKAVIGDAHNVVAQSWSGAEPEELGTIKEGEWAQVNQQRTPQYSPYLSEKDDQGKFPMRLRITSSEASGYITIYFEG